MIRIEDYDPHPIQIARNCMKLLEEVCLGPRTNPLNFGDDTDYEPDPDYEH